MIAIYIISFLLILSVVLYVILIASFTFGWQRLSKQKNIIDFYPSISILIPARNEETNIEHLLQSLYLQEYPRSLLEVIVADDHSEDTTALLVTKFIQNHPDIHVTLHSVKGKGKKSALSESIQIAKGDIIITTDADCIPKTNQWAKSIVSYFSEQTQLVSAPVVYFQKNGWFQKMQSLEFLTLISSAAGAIGNNMPFMCNGANIAFRKSAFLETHGFENDRFSSGDDIFLLERIIQRYGTHSVQFAKTEQAIIETDPMPNLSKFLQQRIRWAGKSVGYKNPVSIITSYIVFFNALSILLAFILGFYHPFFFRLAALLFMVKTIIDLPICIMILNFTRQLFLLKTYLLLQIVYPLYICGTAITSLFVKPKWKGRTVQQ